jgi:2-polyprenyl-6-methoxyphenol hydroxylase-like FAD-dependent oxidoreductase
MVDPGLRVLVVGAGIGGLAAARSLRRAGFQPRVVEKLPSTTVAGAGIYMPGNGARALRALGLHDAVRPLGSVITRQRLHTRTGRLLADVDVTQLWAAVGECRGLPRADLHEVLLAGAGGEVTYESAVTGLEILDEDGVKVEFADGSAAEYDLVVAADGRRSQVRALAGLGGKARPVGQVAYRAVVTGGPDIDAWSVWLGGRTSILAVPIGDGRLYVYADELAPRGQQPTPPDDPLARVRELLQPYGGPVPDLLALVDRVQVAVIEEVDVPAWVRGPVVLIGDAAHATSPNMAQGAAMALEDAVALAEELGRARDVPAALAAYESRRRGRAAWVLDQSHRRDQARYLPRPLRHAVLRWGADAIFRRNYGPLVTAP